MSHSLVRVMNETLQVLEAMNRALDGDTPDEESETELQMRVSDLIKKYQHFSERFKSSPSAAPASEQSMKRLAQLRREVEKKNQNLERLRLGLKSFELEMYLRSGSARKEELATQAEANHTDLTGKRFHLDDSATL